MSMDPQVRLVWLMRVPGHVRTMAWLDALSELYAVIEDEAAVLETHAQTDDEGANALQLAIQKGKAMLAQAEATVAEALGRSQRRRARRRRTASRPRAKCPPTAAPGCCCRFGCRRPDCRCCRREAAWRGATRPARHRPGAAKQAAAGCRVDARLHIGRAPLQRRAAAQRRPPRLLCLFLLAAAARAAADQQQQQQQHRIHGRPGRNGRRRLRRRRRRASTAMPAEANRVAAEEWLAKAQQEHEGGDDATAAKYCEKSLKLCETSGARALAEHLRKYGAGRRRRRRSRVCCRPTSRSFAVLGLARKATGTDVKKAYKRLSLTIHPDRNHARQADEALRLAAAYHLLSEQTLPLAGRRRRRPSGSALGGKGEEGLHPSFPAATAAAAAGARRNRERARARTR